MGTGKQFESSNGLIDKMGSRHRDLYQHLKARALYGFHFGQTAVVAGGTAR